MTGSVRSCFTAGVAAIGATAMAITPVTPTPDAASASAPQVRLAAAQTPSPELRAFIAELQQPQQQRAMPAPPVPPGAPTGPVAQNAASDAIVNLWDFAVPWIDYGVEVADYVLGFIPFGYVIADQINIFYDSLFPIADSFVLDLVAPVVNDPLNLNTWVDGLADVGSATVYSLINLGINEFNYFFGWLIPPIPPIGPLAVDALPAPPGTDLLDGAGFVTEALAAARESIVHAVDDQIAVNNAALKRLAREGVGLAGDLLTLPDRLLTGVVDEAPAPPEAIDTGAQLDVVTGDAASVPVSVQRTPEEGEPVAEDDAAEKSTNVETATEETPTEETPTAKPEKPARKLVRDALRAQREAAAEAGNAVTKSARSVVKAVRDGVRKAADDVKTATDSVGRAVKDSQKGGDDKKSPDSEDKQ